MEHSPASVSTCRFCSHYDPQGRRGGECRKLGVPVRGYWRACPLAVAAFANDISPANPSPTIPQMLMPTLVMSNQV